MSKSHSQAEAQNHTSNPDPSPPNLFPICSAPSFFSGFGSRGCCHPQMFLPDVRPGFLMRHFQLHREFLRVIITTRGTSCSFCFPGLPCHMHYCKLGGLKQQNGFAPSVGDQSLRSKCHRATLPLEAPGEDPSCLFPF